MCERAAASCWKTGSRMAEPGSISGRSWQLSSGLNRGAEGIKLAACGTHNCRHNRWLPVDMPPADASSLRSMVWRDSKGLPLIGPTRRHVHQTRNAEAAWKGSVDCRLDDVRSEEGDDSFQTRSDVDAIPHHERSRRGRRDGGGGGRARGTRPPRCTARASSAIRAVLADYPTSTPI